MVVASDAKTVHTMWEEVTFPLFFQDRRIQTKKNFFLAETATLPATPRTTRNHPSN